MQKTPIFVITGPFNNAKCAPLEVSRANDATWWFRATFIGEKFATAWIPLLIDGIHTAKDGLELPDGYNIERKGDAKLPTEWRDGELDFMEFFNGTAAD